MVKRNIENNYWYDGTTGLRCDKTFVEEFTDEEIELYPIYENNYIKFIEDQLTVVDPEYGRTKMRLRPYQKECIQSAQDNRKNLWNLSRQIGKSTMVESIINPFIIFNVDKTVGIITHDLSKSKDILSNIKKAYNKLPLKWQVPVVKWTDDIIELSNGCRVIVDVFASSDPFRGYPIQFLYGDEVAFATAKDWEKFVDSVLPALSSSTKSKIIFTSTPNRFNHFYRMVKEAQNGMTDYVYKEFWWNAVPGRNEEWKKDIIKNTPSVHRDTLFAQNYECQFIPSGDSIVSQSFLNEYIIIKPIKVIKDLQIYKEPIINHIYGIGVDVGEGGGNDYSTAQVIDFSVQPFEQVAKFKSNLLDGTSFSIILNNMGRYYNNAAMLIENNAYGLSVCERVVMDRDYPNLVSNNKKKLGFNTNAKTKRDKIELFRKLIEHKQLILYDFDTISEITTFVKQPNGTWGGIDGFHDDLVLSLIMALWYIKVNQYEGKDVETDIVNNILDELDDYAPIIISDNSNKNDKMKEVNKVLGAYKQQLNQNNSYIKYD